jgi:hypothetical protein
MVRKPAGKKPFIIWRHKCWGITKLSSINTIGICGLESSASRFGPVADSFEKYNEDLALIKRVYF